MLVASEAMAVALTDTMTGFETKFEIELRKTTTDLILMLAASAAMTVALTNTMTGFRTDFESFVDFEPDSDTAAMTVALTNTMTGFRTELIKTDHDC